MILRRIAHHLKQQQWTAVLIELLILILGVFLGVQVSDWANERANRSAETRRLEEIAEDLRADAEVFDKVMTAAGKRISGIDYIPGETRGVNRPTSLVTPDGTSFDMPAGPPVAPEDRSKLLARANLMRSTAGNRTGFDALLGAGGMQKIRDRQISRQLQVYYAEMDDLEELTNVLKQVRASGVVVGYSLGLSAFGEMGPEQMIAVVRGSPAYSAYLRTNREWTAIYLDIVEQQQQRALKLLADIDAYLGKRAPQAYRSPLRAFHASHRHQPPIPAPNRMTCRSHCVHAPARLSAEPPDHHQHQLEDEFRTRDGCNGLAARPPPDQAEADKDRESNGRKQQDYARRA